MRVSEVASAAQAHGRIVQMCVQKLTSGQQHRVLSARVLNERQPATQGWCAEFSFAVSFVRGGKEKVTHSIHWRISSAMAARINGVPSTPCSGLVSFNTSVESRRRFQTVTAPQDEGFLARPTS